MIEKDRIIISMEEYENLKNTERLYQALESAGVDNWVGYEYAMEIYHEGNN